MLSKSPTGQECIDQNGLKQSFGKNVKIKALKGSGNQSVYVWRDIQTGISNDAFLHSPDMHGTELESGQAWKQLSTSQRPSEQATRDERLTEKRTTSLDSAPVLHILRGFGDSGFGLFFGPRSRGLRFISLNKLGFGAISAISTDSALPLRIHTSCTPARSHS